MAWTTPTMVQYTDHYQQQPNKNIKMKMKLKSFSSTENAILACMQPRPFRLCYSDWFSPVACRQRRASFAARCSVALSMRSLSLDVPGSGGPWMKSPNGGRQVKVGLSAGYSGTPLPELSLCLLFSYFCRNVTHRRHRNMCKSNLDEKAVLHPEVCMCHRFWIRLKRQADFEQMKQKKKKYGHKNGIHNHRSRWAL